MKKSEGKPTSNGLGVCRLYAKLALYSMWCYSFVVTADGLCDNSPQPLTIEVRPLGAQISDRQRGCIGLNDSRVNCTDIQSAIDWLLNQTSVSFGTNLCAEVYLPDGVHKITQPRDLLNISLHLIGDGDSVSVRCRYFADPSLNGSREIHTWYFEGSYSVTFENIHFIQCGFPFRLDTVRNFYVNNCTFRYFTEAVLDVFNCQNVTITNTIVQDNSGTGRLIKTYRGNSGGIAIGFNTLPENYLNPTIHISNTIFQNNQANGFRTPNRAVAAGVYLGRGGGLGLFLNESMQNLTITISDCVFENNSVRLFGAGLFILTQSYLYNQINIFVERCRFGQNSANFGGGGVQLSYLHSGNNSRPHTVIFSHCTFVDNRAPSGSGIYIFVGDDGNLAKLEQCNFTRNTGFGRQLDFGAAVALSFLTVFRQRVISPRHEITNCSFDGNSGPNGVVSIGYAPAVFKGRTLFQNNRGASLRIVGSVVEFESETTFTNNSVAGFGALELLSFAQIRLFSGCKLSFTRNIGNLGASIVVNSPASLSAFTDILFNPKCFVLYEDSRAPPSEWNDVNVTFSENEAIVASSVYVSQTDPCTWFTDVPPYFNDTHVPDWPIWQYIDNRNVGHDDSTNQQFSFGTRAQRISTDINLFRAWPGQRVSMPLQGLDHFSHSTSVNARLFFESHESSSTSAVRFDPEIIVISGRSNEPGGQDLLQKNFLMMYTISNGTLLHTKGDTLGEVRMEEPFNSHLVESDSFLLDPLPCPAGYSFNPASLSTEESMQRCTCLESAEVIICEDDQDNVIIRNDLWAAFVPSRTPNLFFYPCPSGYCRCFQNTSLGTSVCASSFSHSKPDLQCSCNREGVLCGSCKNNSGVSVLFNKCVSCHNAFGTLIVVLVISDVVALTLITLLDKPLPTWIYPFIFYIQVAPYVSQSFAPSFEVVGKYLHFISSATSFYFIYDFCVHSNLSPLVSYFLRYLPLFAALFVFPTMWIIKKRATRFKSLKKHGYWWMLLLLYSHLVHTSVSILNCPRVPDLSGHETLRWYVDGDIECFTGGHIALALLAIVVLALCVTIIPILIVLSNKRPQRIRYWIDPLTAGFRDEVKWWSGIELGRRLLFLLFILSFPNNTVYGMLVLVMSLIVYGYVLPYKSKVANGAEIVIQLNFLTLLVLEATPLFQETLFYFPAPTGDVNMERSGRQCMDEPPSTNSLSWLLLPFYYAPVVGVVTAVIIYSILCFIKRFKKNISTNQGKEEEPHVIQATNVKSMVVEIDYSKEEGEVELHDAAVSTPDDSEDVRTKIQ